MLRIFRRLGHGGDRKLSQRQGSPQYAGRKNDPQQREHHAEESPVHWRTVFPAQRYPGKTVRRYIGELSFRDIVVPDAIPVIVPKDLFDRGQKRLVPCDLIIYIA